MSAPSPWRGSVAAVGRAGAVYLAVWTVAPGVDAHRLIPIAWAAWVLAWGLAVQAHPGARPAGAPWPLIALWTACAWALSVRLLARTGWVTEASDATRLGLSLAVALAQHLAWDGGSAPRRRVILLAAAAGCTWGLSRALGAPGAPGPQASTPRALAAAHAAGSVPSGWALVAQAAQGGADGPTLRQLCPERTPSRLWDAWQMMSEARGGSAVAAGVTQGRALCAALQAVLPEVGVRVLAHAPDAPASVAHAFARIRGDLYAEAGDLPQAGAAYADAGSLGAAAWAWVQHRRGLGPPGPGLSQLSRALPWGPSYTGAAPWGLPGTLIWTPAGPPRGAVFGSHVPRARWEVGSWLMRSRYRGAAAWQVPLAAGTPWPQALHAWVRAGPGLRVHVEGSMGTQQFACLADRSAQALPEAACSLAWAQVTLPLQPQGGTVSKLQFFGELALAQLDFAPGDEG